MRSVLGVSMVLMAFGAFGCATKSVTSIPVAKESVEPGTSVSRGGTKVALTKGHLRVSEPLPQVALTDTTWSPYSFKADGKVKIVSIVPSVDTKVCEEQTHILGESGKIHPAVQRITVSRDLPAAQKRFAAEADLTNVTYLSDFRAGAFGSAAGLLMEESGLLARAVAVVDGEGNVRYLQVVPDVASLPDMQRAIDVANSLVR